MVFVVCCLQLTKLRVVIQSAGGEVVLCDNDSVASDAELISDSACMMWSDVLQELDPGRHSWIQHIQLLLARFSAESILNFLVV